MTAASVNGITIEYDVHGDGDGDALLLVMGLGGQLVAWPLEFVDLMVARGFRVIRFDNRDIGLSTMMPAPPPTRRQLVLATISRRFARSSYLLDDMADDAAALLDHLGIDTAHVVGISMGGMICQSLAIRHPDKVASLTSIMSNTGDRKHGKIKRSLLRKLPKLMVRTPDDAVDNGVEMFRLISGPHFDAAASRQLGEEAYARSFHPEGPARQTMAIAASPDRTWDLRRVRVPTLVVHGLVDPLVTPSGGIATAQAIPGAKLVMYPDMGHDLPRPRWDDIIEEITDNARRAGPDGTAGDRARWAEPVDNRPTLVTLDVEGVLVPEIWIAVADRTGIAELRRTTRDEPDYDVLMRGRLDLLDRHGLTMSLITETIAGLEPLPGAVEFLDTLRASTQVVLLSDTFAEFARPLMAKLGWPTVLCHDLEVVDDRIVGYRLRIADQKRQAVQAFQALGYRVIAGGDSYNDVSMLLAADAGFLFHAPDNVRSEFPQLPAFDTYAELTEAIAAASS